QRLALERLEDRTVPSVLFTASDYQNYTITDGHGPVLHNVHIELIFWGSSWTSNPKLAPSQVEAAIDSLATGPYLRQLSQYRSNIGSGLRVGSVFVTDSDPPVHFTDAMVAQMVQDKLADGTIPVQPGSNDQLLYYVVPSENSFSASDTIAGEHNVFTNSV